MIASSVCPPPLPPFSPFALFTLLFALRPRPLPSFYDRRDIPVTVEHMVNRKLLWQVQDVSRLDYTHYLPLFFHGLRNKTEPYQFLAYEGVMDMLEEAGDRVLICVPELVQPLKVRRRMGVLQQHAPVLIMPGGRRWRGAPERWGVGGWGIGTAGSVRVRVHSAGAEQGRVVRGCVAVCGG